MTLPIKLAIAAVLLLATTSSAFAQGWRLLVPVQAYTVRINVEDPNKLLVGNWANQYFRSEDAGRSWELQILGPGSSGNSLTSFFQSTVDTSVIFGAGFLISGIRRSSDAGETWNWVLRDTNLRRMWFISEAIIEDPNDGNTLYAARGTTYNTVFKSTDVGATWDSISTVSNQLTGRLCTIAARRDSSNILFLGCKAGVIMRSDDSGLTWKRMKVLGDEEFIRDDSEIPKIVFSQRDPMTGYAVVAIAVEENIEGNGGVLKTIDGGLTWNRIGFADTSFWSIDVMPTEDGLNDEVFIGGFRISSSDTIIKGDSLVYRSTDGGDSWSRFKGIEWQENEVGDTIRNIWSIRYDSVGDRMYMATEVGLYVYDGIVSVKELDPIAAKTLSVFVTTSSLTIRDLEPLQSDETWSIYSMDGAQRQTGAIETPVEQSIDVRGLPSGQYLLTWGSAQRFRTVLFSVVR